MASINPNPDKFGELTIWTGYVDGLATVTALKLSDASG